MPRTSNCTWQAADSLSPGLASAARIAVVVVPMLEPRVKGYALSRLITPSPKSVKGQMENELTAE